MERLKGVKLAMMRHMVIDLHSSMERLKVMARLTALMPHWNLHSSMERLKALQDGAPRLTIK